MSGPTEQVGSVPRPAALLQGMADHAAGKISDGEFGQPQQQALRETIQRLEETGSPVITDGEQTKPGFVTYPIDGLPGLAAGGVRIPFSDGYERQLPQAGSTCSWPASRTGAGCCPSSGTTCGRSSGCSSG